MRTIRCVLIVVFARKRVRKSAFKWTARLKINRRRRINMGYTNVVLLWLYTVVSMQFPTPITESHAYVRLVPWHLYSFRDRYRGKNNPVR